MDLRLGRRSDPALVGLDIQPGFVAAVQARVNGSILAERAAALPLAADTVRDGEVVDEGALSEVLRELFKDSGMSKRVRIGVANQRTVLRTLELPALTDEKELAAAVRFQAQDQVPMPLNNAVLDFHPLGIVETPEGPRQRVVLVAAQRDMVERLLSAVRNAGLSPEGVDLSAFALIRSLHHPGSPEDERVLYLNVDGLTNLAIAEGRICRFTRVVGSGLEGIAAELAVRRGIALTEARALLAAVDLNAALANAAPPVQAPVEAPPVEQPRHEEEEVSLQEAAPEEHHGEQADAGEPAFEGESLDAHEHEAREAAMSYEEMAAAGQAAPALAEPSAEPQPEADVLEVLDNGIRELSGEVRNSLDFHRSQEGGGDVSRVVLSGAAQDIPGFAEVLQASLGVEVLCHAVGLADERLAGTVSTHRLAIATGLAALEAPQ